MTDKQAINRAYTALRRSLGYVNGQVIQLHGIKCMEETRDSLCDIRYKLEIELEIINEKLKEL